MTKQYKIFSAISIFAILILAAWGLFFNHGFVNIESSISEYQLKINDQTYNCINTCSVKLKPGSYTLDLTAKGYTSFSQKIYLLKNESESIIYNPLKQVEFELITDFEQPKLPTLAQQDAGQVVLLNNEIITTFKNPLKDSIIITSPSQNTILIYGLNSETDDTEYHLVNVKEKSKQKITLPISTNLITNLKLLNDTTILFESDSKVFSYNTSDKNLNIIPVLSTGHILELNQSQKIILTSRKLDSTASIVMNSLNQLTQLDSENLEEELLQNPDKIYLYDLNTSSYVYLQDLDPEFEFPMEFKTVLLNENLTSVLLANQNYYKISK